MAIVSKTVLKSYFEDGKEPDESKYIDLIDTMVLQGGSIVTGIETPPFTVPDGTIFVHDDGPNDYGFMSAEGPFFFSSNTYYDGSNWRAIKTGKSLTFYLNYDSGIYYRTDAFSRSPGEIPTHTNMMTMDLFGNMKLAGGAVIGNVAGTVDDDNMTFYQGATRMGEIGSDNTSWLKINHVTDKPIYTPRYFRADGGVSGTASISDPGDGRIAAQRFDIYEGGSLLGDISAADSTWLRINQIISKNIYTPRFLAAANGLQAGGSTNPGVGYVGYTAGLRPNKNSTQYYGYSYVPLSAPLINSSSWDGHPKTGSGIQSFNLNSGWGLPLNVKAVNVQLMARDSAAHMANDLYFSVGPHTDYWWAFTLRPHGGDHIEDDTAIVNTYLSGSTPYLYYRINSSGSGTMDCWVRIWGYFI